MKTNTLTSRTFRGIPVIALGLAGFVSTASATLQVYEPFDYTAGLGTTLNTQNGGTGFDAGSSWSAGNSNTYPSGSPPALLFNSLPFNSQNPKIKIPPPYASVAGWSTYGKS